MVTKGSCALLAAVWLCSYLHMGVYTATHTPHTPPSLLSLLQLSPELFALSHPVPHLRPLIWELPLRFFLSEFLEGLKSIPCNLAPNYMPSGHSL